MIKLLFPSLFLHFYIGSTLADVPFSYCGSKCTIVSFNYYIKVPRTEAFEVITVTDRSQLSSIESSYSALAATRSQTLIVHTTSGTQAILPDPTYIDIGGGRSSEVPCCGEYRVDVVGLQNEDPTCTSTPMTRIPILPDDANAVFVTAIPAKDVEGFDVNKIIGKNNCTTIIPQFGDSPNAPITTKTLVINLQEEATGGPQVAGGMPVTPNQPAPQPIAATNAPAAQDQNRGDSGTSGSGSSGVSNSGSSSGSDSGSNPVSSNGNNVDGSQNLSGSGSPSTNPGRSNRIDGSSPGQPKTDGVDGNGDVYQQPSAAEAGQEQQNVKLSLMAAVIAFAGIVVL